VRLARSLPLRGAAVGAIAAGLLTGCTGSAPASPPPAPTKPPPASSTGPSATEAASCPTGQLSDWPVSRLAAQLVVVPSVGFSSAALGPVARLGVGGVLLLGDQPPPADLAAEVGTLDRQTPGSVPLLVMADQEGGGVQRLGGLVGSLPWPRQMAETMTPAEVQAAAERLGRQMLALGVGADLAPVVDVDGGAGPNSTDADGLRSFSAVPAVAARYSVAFARGLAAAGVLAVAKHFPGLGGTDGNTDLGPAATPPLSTLQRSGLVPFRAAIAAGVPAVMVANASVPGLTALPASVSPQVIGGLLRTGLRFRGLVLTDSLSAGAVSAAGYSVPAAAAAAVSAGADLVLFGSTLDAGQTALLAPRRVLASTLAIIGAVESAVSSGRLPLARLRAAARLVLQAKHYSICA
jgi:beta-N-acetylhexosaminidase